MPAGHEDVIVLARTIMGEADGEPWEGKIAVAVVILNRARRFRKTIAEVCLQPQQFSCWNGGVLSSRLVQATLAMPNYRECFRAALSVLDGDALALVPANCYHYFTTAQPAGTPVWPPVWARGGTCVAVIGAHSFYTGIA